MYMYVDAHTCTPRNGPARKKQKKVCAREKITMVVARAPFTLYTTWAADLFFFPLFFSFFFFSPLHPRNSSQPNPTALVIKVWKKEGGAHDEATRAVEVLLWTLRFQTASTSLFQSLVLRNFSKQIWIFLDGHKSKMNHPVGLHTLLASIVPSQALTLVLFSCLFVHVHPPPRMEHSDHLWEIVWKRR